MKIATRCIPVGALSYDDVSSAAKMIAKLFEHIPYLPLFPNIDKNDSLVKRTLLNIPGIVFDAKGRVSIKTTSKHYKQGIVKLDKAYNSLENQHLDAYAIESVFLEKYFALIKKFKPAHACINLLGPFTLAQILKNTSDEQMLLEKTYRKLFIQAICVKSLWLIKKIKEISPNTVPIVILEEPRACMFGQIKRETEEVTADMVIHLYERIIEKIRPEGAYIGVQSFEKCDWTIPMSAGVDFISFDAYNNPNNLCIITEQVINFVSRGGKINWAMVPVMTESIVKSLNTEYLTQRLKATMEGLIVAGVPERFVYNSSVVSVNGDTNKLPLIFAEKALILSTQLSKKIPVVTSKPVEE